MAHTPNFTAQLTNKELVIKAASGIGCIQTRGIGKGQGSIREMLENIGGGEVLIMFHAFDEPGEMKRTAKQVLKLTADMHPHDNLKELLTALSKSLERAADLKAECEE